MRILAISLLLILIGHATAGDQPPTAAQSKTIRGWLSDEVCAGGRAEAGTYTGTNPRCAKECVAKGKKIVLVDPEAKRLLKIENQTAARAHVGDFVEIRGALNSPAKSLHIDSLKMVSKGVAACARPKLSE